jgi:hypothetical protein
MRASKFDQTQIEKVLGKRHTVMHEPYYEVSKRLKSLEIKTAFEEIQNAVYFLPRVEKEVEKTFVEDIKEKLDDIEKDAVDATYKFRRKRVDRLAYISFLKAQEPEVYEWPLPRRLPLFLINDEEHPKEEDIGQYFDLEEEDVRVLFRNGYFGDFWQNHVVYCRSYDIMMREETWRLINNARNTQKFIPNKEEEEEEEEEEEQGEQGEKEEGEQEEGEKEEGEQEEGEQEEQEEEMDYSAIEGKEPLQALGWMIFNHKATYLELHKKISSLMLDHLYSTEDLSLFQIMRNSAELFNSTIAIIIHELSKSQLFHHFSNLFTFTDPVSFLSEVLESDSLKAVVKGILENYSSVVTDPKDINSVIHFEPFVKFLAKEFRFSLNGEEIVIPLQQYTDRKIRFRVPPRLEEEVDKPGSLGVGAVISGHRGTGKSQVLAGVAAWGYKEGNWVIIKVPRGSDFTKGASPYFYDPVGMYVQPEIGWDLLKEISELNSDKLEKIPVDLKSYGKFNVSGMHPDYDKGNEPLVGKHVYMREEKFWTDHWKQFYDEESLELIMKGPRYYNFLPRMSRFEYEENLLSKERIPKSFTDLFEEGPLLYDSMDTDKAFNLDIPKRKPKKRMDPKTSREDLNFRIREKTIHPQNLVIGTPNIGDLEEVVPQLSKVLPSPKNLKELVDFGLSKHVHSINVLYELMDQLYRTDKCNVMVLVDEFDAFFKNSDFPSIKYMNFRHCREAIAPADIALCHLFMRFDGHMIRNGVKIVAVSEKEMNYHVRRWKGDPVNAGPDCCVEIDKIPLDDLRKMVKYLYFFGWTDFEMSESDIAGIHMMSQGNVSLALQNIMFSVEPSY